MLERLRQYLGRYFEIAPGGDGSRLQSMEGLRGLAVLLVFVVHYVQLTGDWFSSHPTLVEIGQRMSSAGHTGVDLFFVLSGYLIYKSVINKPVPLLPYYRRRIERIYPVFTVVFVLYLILQYAIPSQNKIPADGKEAAIFLIANFFLLPGLVDILPMITVAWSLSFEIFYYLLTPTLVSWLGMRSWSPRRRISFVLILVLLFTGYCWFLGGPLRMILFASGILVYEMVDHQHLTLRSPLAWAGLAASLACAAALRGYETGGIWKVRPAQVEDTVQIWVLGVGFFALTAAAFSKGESVRKVFTWTPLRWLGNISYSYYLGHSLGLHAAVMVLGLVLGRAALPAWTFWAMMPLMFVATLPIAIVLFLLVERPFSLAKPKSAALVEPRPLAQARRDV